MARTYNTAQLAELLRISGSDCVKLLKKHGLKPMREIKTASRVYRHWGRDAYDQVQLILAERNKPQAAPAATPAPAPFDDKLVSGGNLGLVAMHLPAPAPSDPVMAQLLAQLSRVEQTLDMVLTHLTTPRVAS